MAVSKSGVCSRSQDRFVYPLCQQGEALRHHKNIPQLTRGPWYQSGGRLAGPLTYNNMIDREECGRERISGVFKPKVFLMSRCDNLKSKAITGGQWTGSPPSIDSLAKGNPKLETGRFNDTVLLFLDQT
ncbi:hypothetical protein RRG08_048776 [Elysia crispata]|uniref:Uncharacterized protein n=1 Tax=Elysia crispata TaxID=231223 RepID=A0AAE1E1Z7_9GAST|nr:hypothetical protein RRG08_048776 [Elysia crispata]